VTIIILFSYSCVFQIEH